MCSPPPLTLPPPSNSWSLGRQPHPIRALLNADPIVGFISTIDRARPLLQLHYYKRDGRITIFYLGCTVVTDDVFPVGGDMSQLRDVLAKFMEIFATKCRSGGHLLPGNNVCLSSLETAAANEIAAERCAGRKVLLLLGADIIIFHYNLRVDEHDYLYERMVSSKVPWRASIVVSEFMSAAFTRLWFERRPWNMEGEERACAKYSAMDMDDYGIREQKYELGTYKWSHEEASMEPSEWLLSFHHIINSFGPDVWLQDELISGPMTNISVATGRRKNKSAPWFATPYEMLRISAKHGYFTSKKRTVLLDALLLAACSSAASTGRSSRGSITPNNIQLLLDSGASIHVVGNASLLRGFRRLTGNARRIVTLPDGSIVIIIGVGTIQMDGFSIPEVYFVEGLTVNLISVSQLTTNHGICCCFYGNRCQLFTLPGGTRIGEAMLEGNGVYGLRFLRVPDAAAGSSRQ